MNQKLKKELKEYFPTFAALINRILSLFKRPVTKVALPNKSGTLELNKSASYESGKRGTQVGTIVSFDSSGRARLDLGGGVFVRRKTHLLTPIPA